MLPTSAGRRAPRIHTILGNPMVAYGGKFVIVSGRLGEDADHQQQRDKTGDYHRSSYPEHLARSVKRSCSNRSRCLGMLVGFEVCLRGGSIIVSVTVLTRPPSLPPFPNCHNTKHFTAELCVNELWHCGCLSCGTAVAELGATQHVRRPSVPRPGQRIDVRCSPAFSESY
jgi:hypothetical protein